MLAKIRVFGNLKNSTIIFSFGMIVFGLFILWIGNFSDIDTYLADAIFDWNHKRFPWRDAWIADRFNHIILKQVLMIFALVVIATTLWDLKSKQTNWIPSFRVGIRVLALSAIAVPSAISFLKYLSYSHCPWDLRRYGGKEALISLLDVIPQGTTQGHCLPAGHASSALWLLAIAVFWLPNRPMKAAIVALGMLLFGFVVGWMQQLRGAHFLSHTLWSIWIAIFIVYMLYQMLKSDDKHARK